MKSLDDMDIGHRVMLTAAIVIVLLILLGCFGYLSGRWEDQSKFSRFELASEQQVALISFGQSVVLAQGQPIDVYAGIPPDTRLLAFDKQALEQAYIARVIRLFDVWLSSAGGQDPTQFQNGLVIARRGYTLASQALAKREAEIERQVRPQQQDQRK